MGIVFDIVPVNVVLAGIDLLPVSEGFWGVVGQIISVAACVIASVLLRCPDSKAVKSARYIPDPAEQVFISLGWGTFVITAFSLGMMGIARYGAGEGIPSIFFFALSVCLGSLALIGAEPEINGNVFADSLLVSLVISAVSFTVINGIPVVPRVFCKTVFCLWALGCVGVAVITRAILWAKEG